MQRYLIIRALKNIYKLPGRSLLIAVVLFTSTLLIFIGVSIRSGAEQRLLEARKSLGSTVNLQPNIEEAQKKVMENAEPGMSSPLPQLSWVTEELAAKLASSKHVEKFNLCIDQTAPADIVPVSSGVEGAGSNILGGANIPGSQPEFRINGDSEPELQADFLDGSKKLVEGRLLTKEDESLNSNTALISKLVADKNNLKIGSTFSIQSLNSSVLENVNVVGIYIETSPENLNAPALFIQSNDIFVPYRLARSITAGSSSYLPGGYVTYAAYYLDDPANIDEFRDEAQSLGLDLKKYSLDANDSMYSRMTGPVQKVSDLAEIGVIIALISGIFLIIIIMTAVTRRRAYEVGILRSLGAGKSEIAAQFAIEAVIICIISLTAACFVGKSTAQFTADFMLNNSIKAQIEINEQHNKIFMVKDGNMLVQNNKSFISASNGNLKIIDNINADAGAIQVMQFLFAGIFMILCGSIASVYWVIKYEPMKIINSRNLGGTNFGGDI